MWKEGKGQHIGVRGLSGASASWERLGSGASVGLRPFVYGSRGPGGHVLRRLLMQVGQLCLGRELSAGQCNMRNRKERGLESIRTAELTGCARFQH